MPFVIKVWIPVEIENPQKYKTKEKADRDAESLKLMSTDNIYEVVEVV